MSNRDRLMKLTAGLPEDLAGEVADFAEYLAAKRDRQAGAEAELDEESRAWLDADLSRLGEIEPYDWGPEGPPAGKPIAWDEARQAFVIVGGRDAAS